VRLTVSFEHGSVSAAKRSRIHASALPGIIRRRHRRARCVRVLFKNPAKIARQDRCLFAFGHKGSSRRLRFLLGIRRRCRSRRLTDVIAFRPAGRGFARDTARPGGTRGDPRSPFLMMLVSPVK